MTASDAAEDDYFGCSVEIAGGVVVLAPTATATTPAQLPCPTDGGADVEVAKLTAADGAWATIRNLRSHRRRHCCGRRYDGNAGSNSGSAYVFRTTDGGAMYAQVAGLTASDAWRPLRLPAGRWQHDRGWCLR